MYTSCLISPSRWIRLYIFAGSFRESTKEPGHAHSVHITRTLQSLTHAVSLHTSRIFFFRDRQVLFDFSVPIQVATKEWTPFFDNAVSTLHSQNFNCQQMFFEIHLKNTKRLPNIPRKWSTYIIPWSFQKADLMQEYFPRAVSTTRWQKERLAWQSPPYLSVKQHEA